MGRTTVIDGGTDCDASIVDRSAEDCVSIEPGTGGAAAVGDSGNESVSAGSEKQAVYEGEGQASDHKADLNPAHSWFQLPGPERRRFGQCFSLMVLKALGRRSFTEEQS
jgi:Ca2+-binding RTX toxin-like protein